MSKETFKSSLPRYLAMMGVYMVCLTVLKVVEYFVMVSVGHGGGKILVNALVYNLISASWVGLGIGVIYFLIRLLSQKAASVTAALLYGLLLLSELGLTLYVSHNGFLLGCELVARPIGETLMAVKGAMGIVWPVVLILVILGGFVTLALWRAWHPSRASWAVLVVMAVMMLLSIVFKMSHLLVEGYNDYILNKTLFLAADCRDYYQHARNASKLSDEGGVAFDEGLLTELLATHPEWGTPSDIRYPLERSTPVDTFLSPYFQDIHGNQPPNVVIVIVESLGAEIMGSGAMPFVDSLAATGLYWPNCLSTTTRSYGAIPGITGSVGGPKSFQFGIMPDHNSLFALLKAAGYDTRAYYAGDFNFDCVYEYLSAQDIDYFSPLFEEFNATPVWQRANSWGYGDDTLFAYTLRDLNRFSRQQPNKPHLSLVTTLSMHEELHLANTAQQRDYEQRAAMLPSTSSGQKLASLFPACLFTDDCLRQFMHCYSHISGYENTLFVITGDHATGRQQGDKLSYHHVPLILWSPLIGRPHAFPHVVTHNDVTPALYGLLTSRYGLRAHPTVHWLGDGLGPTPKTLLVVNYVHEIKDIVFHNHYYQSGDNFSDENCYTFGRDLLLRPCSDVAVLDSCKRQLELMRYLYSYTYLSNRLTAH
ncbi:MAG: LTA synthase family protein, partial [Bacteroidales bacterium]|nr:LTA synthase family protein [Bacteroidales bacterium]